MLDADSHAAHGNHMSDLRSRKPGRDWRSFLTPEEKREIARLEKEIAKAVEAADTARRKRQKIQNRATVRAGK